MEPDNLLHCPHDHAPVERACPPGGGAGSKVVHYFDGHVRLRDDDGLTSSEVGNGDFVREDLFWAESQREVCDMGRRGLMVWREREERGRGEKSRYLYTTSWGPRMRVPVVVCFPCVVFLFERQ